MPLRESEVLAEAMRIVDCARTGTEYTPPMQAIKVTDIVRGVAEELGEIKKKRPFLAGLYVGGSILYVGMSLILEKSRQKYR